MRQLKIAFCVLTYLIQGYRWKRESNPCCRD